MLTLNKPQLVLNNFSSTYTPQHLEMFFKSACLNPNILNIKTTLTPNFQVKIEFTSRQIMKNVVDKLQKLKATGTQKFEIHSLDSNIECQSKYIIGMDKNSLIKKTQEKSSYKFKIFTLSQYNSHFPIQNQSSNDKDYYYPKKYYYAKSSQKQTSTYHKYNPKSNYQYNDKYQASYYNQIHNKSRQRSRPYKRSISKSPKKIYDYSYQQRNFIKKQQNRLFNKQNLQKKTFITQEEHKLIQMTPRTPLHIQEKTSQKVSEILQQSPIQNIQTLIVEEKEKPIIVIQSKTLNERIESNIVIENKFTSPSHIIEQKSPITPIQIKNQKQKQRVAQLLKNKQLLNLLLRKSTTVLNQASKSNDLSQVVIKQAIQTPIQLKNTTPVTLSGSKKKKKL